MNNIIIEKDEDGLRHNDDGPAVIMPNGTKKWYQHGELHRDDDQPAIHTYDGLQKWYQHGKLHRINKPAVVKENGNEEYYLNGLLHREDGPAKIENGIKQFYNEGKLKAHETDVQIKIVDGQDEDEIVLNSQVIIQKIKELNEENRTISSIQIDDKTYLIKDDKLVLA